MKYSKLSNEDIIKIIDDLPNLAVDEKKFYFKELLILDYKIQIFCGEKTSSEPNISLKLISSYYKIPITILYKGKNVFISQLLEEYKITLNSDMWVYSNDNMLSGNIFSLCEFFKNFERSLNLRIFI